MLSIEDYLRLRGDVTSELLEDARQRTQEYVHAYELAEARKRAKVTQVELAQRMGVSQKRVSSLEHGRLEATQLGTLRRYVGGLGGTLHIVAEFSDEVIEVM